MERGRGGGAAQDGNGDGADRPMEDRFVRAEALIEELRPESPLRLRLSQELEELRRLR